VPVRIVAIALAAFAVAGCGADTVLRIEVEPGGLAPASLVVSLPQLGAPPRTIAPVTLPGTIVVHRLPASVAQLCVEVDALDVGGNPIGGGAATVHVVHDGTATTTITLADPAVGCADVAGDMGGPPLDLATDNDMGGPLIGADMTPVKICPPGSIFCDDFEGDGFAQWNSANAKLDAGNVSVQSLIKAHGTSAMKALANGAPGADVYADAEKDFTPTAPPLALRANVYFPTTLQHFDHVIALYEGNGSTNAFAIGGDSAGNWVIAENEATVADRTSDMVPTGAGQWHCIELVIDAAANVTLFVDNHRLIGPFARATTGITYSQLLVGVVRSVDMDYIAYVDDVAVGPSRLYCPP
jgi:hypothetical protein